MALMMIVLYFRYSHFRITSNNEIKALRKKFDDQNDALRVADQKLVEVTKNDTQKIQDLLSEIDELRKDKENEIKLRLAAEKQIALTLQNMENLEKRMEDWRATQDAVMRDSKEAIVKVGNDLFKKLNQSYNQSIETNKNILGRFAQNIGSFFAKNSPPQQNNSPKIESKNTVQEPKKIAKFNFEGTGLTKIVDDLIETMKAVGMLANKDYFQAKNLDSELAKMMLCEMAVVKNHNLYLLDFKLSEALAEYQEQKLSKPDQAKNDLASKLDAYLNYLVDPNYLNSVAKSLSKSNAEFKKTKVVIAVNSAAEINSIKEIEAYEKIQKNGLELMETKDINNIIL